MSAGGLSVLITSLIASVAYIGAVREWALFVMLLPLVFVVGCFAGWLRQRPARAMAAVVALPIAGGEVINVLSGNFQGSVARGSSGAAFLTGAAVLLSASRRPASFLIPVGANLTWALALGAGNRVQLVAVLTGAAAVLSLSVVERESRHYETPSRLAPTTVLAVGLVVLTGLAVASYQRQYDTRSAASPFRASLASTIEPPAVLALTRHPPPSATQASPPTATAPKAAIRHDRLRASLVAVGWALAALVPLAAVLSVLWLLWVDLAWRRLRRRLRRSQDQEAVGAWTWITVNLDRLGAPLPRSVSPDLASADEAGVSASLQTLARSISLRLFGPDSLGAEDDELWPQARDVVDEAWREAGRWRRALARWRRPARPVHAH